MIKVLLVDDHRLIRDGIRFYLEKQEDEITIAGEASDGKQALIFLEKNPDTVDIMLTDISMPEMNGVELPKWDYRVPGVTSISADVHKYGYAAKGASTITYRNLDYLKHQMFVQPDWPGGVFASSALLGTRPGGAYAAAWATLQYFGKSGYRKLADETKQAVDALKAGVESIPELSVMGKPNGPLFAYLSNDPAVNIFAVVINGYIVCSC